MYAVVPLLALPVLAYNVLLLAMGGLRSTTAAAHLAGRAFSIPMSSGALWDVTVSDLLLSASLVVLFIELLKSASSRRLEIINHSLTMLLFVACLVEFLLLPGFATSTFFMVTLMVLLDVLAGFIVTIVASRRDIDLVRQDGA